MSSERQYHLEIIIVKKAMHAFKKVDFPWISPYLYNYQSRLAIMAIAAEYRGKRCIAPNRECARWIFRWDGASWKF